MVTSVGATGVII